LLNRFASWCKARWTRNEKHRRGGASLQRFARSTALLAGRPVTFFAAVSIVVIWAVTGPIFHFSDTWQLVINAGTTIVIFLMVFLIQQSQKRDTMAVRIKLAELIIAGEAARNALASAEDLSEHELTLLHQTFCKKAADP
jgi:low affinity Fe/Cu permease